MEDLDDEPQENAEKVEDVAKREDEADKLKYERMSIDYTRYAIQVANAIKELDSKHHEICETTLTDPSQVPRDVAQEIF